MYLFAYLQVFQVKKYLNVSGKQAVNKCFKLAIKQPILDILRGSEISKNTKKESANCLFHLQLTLLLSVGHLGLEICLVETQRLRSLLSAQLVQTNRTKSITVGESPTKKSG